MYSTSHVFTKTAKITLELRGIDPEVDFPGLARCLFESHENPPQKIFHIFFPIHGAGKDARETAIAEAAARLKRWHTQDPTSYWQKAFDVKTGKIVGGANWRIYKENPYAVPDSFEVTWFPDDSSRVYVEKALENYSKPRARVAQKPHLCELTCPVVTLFSKLINRTDLFLVYIHPAYRRKGLGQQVMDWGIRKADELGYDIFLESTPYGRSLYEANCFKYIEEYVTHPQTEDPDEKWKEIDEKVGPFTFWLMCRPYGEKV